MISRITLIGSICFLALFTSCNHEPDDFVFIPASDYYPMHLGNFIIYTVDSIKYHETIPTDSSHYEVKEVIADTFYDIEGRLNYSIERYTSHDDEEFVLQNIWSVMDNRGNIEKVENNLRFIKLISGVQKGVVWDGHAYLGGLEDIPVPEQCNNYSFLEGWQFKYTSVDEPFTVGEFNFDNSVTVEESGAINLVDYNYSKEVYAKNVGLVYKEFYHYYDDDTDCPDCPWLEHVECGYSVIMKVKEF